MKRTSRVLFVLLANIVTVLAGCGGNLPADDASITGLHFTTSSAFPTNPPPVDVDVTLTDPTPSRAIYVATLAQPTFPAGVFNCPNDPGYRHMLPFINGQAVAITAILNPYGCRDLTIEGMPPQRRTDDVYWAQLAENLGVEASTLFAVTSH